MSKQTHPHNRLMLCGILGEYPKEHSTAKLKTLQSGVKNFAVRVNKNVAGIK